jgi:hypothetical protein
VVCWAIVSSFRLKAIAMAEMSESLVKLYEPALVTNLAMLLLARKYRGIIAPYRNISEAISVIDSSVMRKSSYIVSLSYETGSAGCAEMTVASEAEIASAAKTIAAENVGEINVNEAHRRRAENGKKNRR